ncbi:MAG: hypothetical protein IPH42_14810 [Bacteroidetes bacterium]|nr:hypothetical protein [Bacteroidota bacterium]
MKIFKRIFNLISLVFIILLASIGVGIAGGIPPSMGNRKMQDRSDIKIELFEVKTKRAGNGNVGCQRIMYRI